MKELETPEGKSGREIGKKDSLGRATLQKCASIQSKGEVQIRDNSAVKSSDRLSNY